MTSDSFGKENRSVPARRGSAHVQTKIRIGVCLMCVFGFLWRASKVRWKEGHKIGRWCWKSPNFAIFLKSGYSKLNSCYGALMRLGDCGKAWGHCPLTLMPASTVIQFPEPSSWSLSSRAKLGFSSGPEAHSVLEKSFVMSIDLIIFKGPKYSTSLHCSLILKKAKICNVSPSI